MRKRCIVTNENGRENGAADERGDESTENEPTRMPARVPDEARDDVAERPGSGATDHEHADKLVDEWSEDSFPSSDPPAHY